MEAAGAGRELETLARSRQAPPNESMNTVAVWQLTPRVVVSADLVDRDHPTERLDQPGVAVDPAVGAGSKDEVDIPGGFGRRSLATNSRGVRAGEPGTGGSSHGCLRHPCC
jgi:hypothetical protein